MGLSWWHVLIVLLVFVLLFGTGKITGFMSDLAKGIKSFKKEMHEGDEEPEPEPVRERKVIEHKPAAPAARKPRSGARAKSTRARKSS